MKKANNFALIYCIIVMIIIVYETIASKDPWKLFELMGYVLAIIYIIANGKLITEFKRGTKGNRWIVYQTLMHDIEIFVTTNKTDTIIESEVVTRNVRAKNGKEAIRKFEKETEHIKAHSKSNIIAIELQFLRNIE